MAKPEPFEKPTGFRDLLPASCEKKRLVETCVSDRFESWGYREIATPILEFYETVGKACAIEDHRLFKCLDREGRTLVLRPDCTAPIARVVGTVLKNEPLPLRLHYRGSVFRAQEGEAGRPSELFQSGVELIGEGGAEADAEVVALAVEAFRAVGVTEFQISAGHVELLDAMLAERIGKEKDRRQLKEALGRRDMVRFRQLSEQLLGKDGAEAWLSLFRPGSGWSVLGNIRRWSCSACVSEAVSRLEEMWEYLTDLGVEDSVSLELGLVGRLHYYTGLYFEGYASGIGGPVLSGGRYDRLCAVFGRSLPAVGFALLTDRLAEASPLEPHRRERVAVLYRAEARKQALVLAERLRAEGAAAVPVRLRRESEVSLAEFDRVCVVDESGRERDWC
jgi:ATP phosphoribosyltransferase regulatory subunit